MSYVINKGLEDLSEEERFFWKFDLDFFWYDWNLDNSCNYIFQFFAKDA